MLRSSESLPPPNQGPMIYLCQVLLKLLEPLKYQLILTIWQIVWFMFVIYFKKINHDSYHFIATHRLMIDDHATRRENPWCFDRGSSPHLSTTWPLELFRSRSSKEWSSKKSLGNVFSPKIGNFRIIRILYKAYFWPYFLGIFPYIGLKYRPFIW